MMSCIFLKVFEYWGREILKVVVNIVLCGRGFKFCIGRWGMVIYFFDCGFFIVICKVIKIREFKFILFFFNFCSNCLYSFKRWICNRNWMFGVEGLSFKNNLCWLFCCLMIVLYLVCLEGFIKVFIIVLMVCFNKVFFLIL